MFCRDVIDFALVAVYGLYNSSVFPPAGPQEAYAEVLCCSALNSPKAHRREGYLNTEQVKPVKFTLLY
jgi:hypothetical protein